MKHLLIPENEISLNFVIIFTSALPDVVIVNLVSVADLVGGYHKNHLDF